MSAAVPHCGTEHPTPDDTPTKVFTQTSFARHSCIAPPFVHVNGAHGTAATCQVAPLQVAVTSPAPLQSRYVQVACTEQLEPALGAGSGHGDGGLLVPPLPALAPEAPPAPEVPLAPALPAVPPLPKTGPPPVDVCTSGPDGGDSSLPEHATVTAKTSPALTQAPLYMRE